MVVRVLVRLGRRGRTVVSGGGRHAQWLWGRGLAGGRRAARARPGWRAARAAATFAGAGPAAQMHGTAWPWSAPMPWAQAAGTRGPGVHSAAAAGPRDAPVGSGARAASQGDRRSSAARLGLRGAAAGTGRSGRLLTACAEAWLRARREPADSL
jgi:hypothetical protein